MNARRCLALLIVIPALASAECLPEAEDDPKLVLLETAERAWQEYRDATCELFSGRDDPAQQAEARAACPAFYAREREQELRLMERALTFTNVRSIFPHP